MGRRRWQSVLALLLAGLTAGAGWTWWQGHRVHQAITEIESEMAAGRHGIAARHLTQLLAWAPDCDQAAYLLGVCERARGRNREAEQAWGRVRPGSSFSSCAISDRLSLLVDTGQFARAEHVTNEAAEARPNDRAALRILLVPLFIQQGRLEEAERLIEERWRQLHATGEEASELAVNLGRLSLELRWTAPPVEELRASLDRAAALAPDDDRVWLGQANLALRTGALDAAERLVYACLKSRADDLSVWRAHLNWAMAANRAEAVHLALSHLPAGRSTPAEVFRIQAWLAARQGDHLAERQALDQLVVADPADLNALKRLGALARENAQPEHAAEIERGQAKIAALNDRLHRLYDRNQPIRDAMEMGQLAKELGHTFVARVFFTVAAAKSLHRDEAERSLQSLNQHSAHHTQSATTLADVVSSQPGGADTREQGSTRSK